MPSNDWTIGLQYQKTWNNIAWSQPDGIGTRVFPQQITGNSNILSVEPFSELTGTFLFGCGHSVDQVMVFQDWDYDTGMSVALICCAICTFVQSRIEPYIEALTNPLQFAILYPGAST